MKSTYNTHHAKVKTGEKQGSVVLHDAKHDRRDPDDGFRLRHDSQRVCQMRDQGRSQGAGEGYKKGAKTMNTAKLVLTILFMEVVFILSAYQVRGLWLAIKEADAKYNRTHYTHAK